MKISDTRSGGKCEIRFDGALSIDCVAQTKNALMAVLGDDGTVELDLSNIAECDTAGVQLLLMLRAEVRARGREFATTLLSPQLLRSMERIGLAADALAATGS